MTHYTDEMIMIRAMPCPKCGARPREHCKRKPNKDGRIKNHEQRMWYWHQFIKSLNNDKFSKTTTNRS